MSWQDGAVTVEDAVPTSFALSGDVLRTTFLPSIGTVTFGAVRMRDRSMRVGPLTLIRFGPPKISQHAVSWPIEGGLLAAMPGGRFGIDAGGGELKATLEGYRPMLPRSIYELTQLRLHHAVVRVQLLRLAALVPPGAPVTPGARMAAAGIDAAVCAGLTLVLARRRRGSAFVRIATAYHLACWSVTGRTVGGRMLGQRVVSVDGSRVTLVQAALRLTALPLAVLHRRAVHDDIAATAVVAG